MEVAQIVITPKISEAEKQKVKDKLNEFKKDIGRFLLPTGFVFGKILQQQMVVL
jgi:hypothetical protein